MSEGAAAPYICPDGEHHWVSSHEPYAPMWIIECSMCGRHNFDEMLRGYHQSHVKKEGYAVKVQEEREELMSTEYTPTTSGIRNSYAGWASTGIGDPANHGFEQKKMEREFDRWIQSHDRNLKAIAWTEGYMAGSDYQRAYQEQGENDGE